MNLSTQYIGAIVIIIISLLKAFGIEVASEAVTGVITGIIAIIIAIKRYKQGDITVVGRRK